VLQYCDGRYYTLTDLPKTGTFFFLFCIKTWLLIFLLWDCLQLVSQSERELEVASISENQLVLNAAHFDALFISNLMAKVEGARPGPPSYLFTYFATDCVDRLCVCGVCTGTSNFELEAIIQTSFRDYTQSLVSLAYGEEVLLICFKIFVLTFSFLSKHVSFLRSSPTM
jgi:hypothetical protein